MGLLGALGKMILGAIPRALTGMGISKATKKVIQSAEESEIQKFTPREGTLGPQPTAEQRREMGEQIAQAHITRGRRRMGWGGVVAGVAVGIAVAMMLPASVPFAAGAVISGIAGTAVEAGVGVLAGAPVPGSQNPAAAEEKGAQVSGMVPSDGGSTVQRQNTDPSEGEPSEPDPGPFVGGTTTGTTPHEGTSTTTTTTTTTEESTSTHEEPHEPPPPAHEDPHEDFDD